MSDHLRTYASLFERITGWASAAAASGWWRTIGSSCVTRTLEPALISLQAIPPAAASSHDAIHVDRDRQVNPPSLRAHAVDLLLYHPRTHREVDAMRSGAPAPADEPLSTETDCADVHAGCR